MIRLLSLAALTLSMLAIGVPATAKVDVERVPNIPTLRLEGSEIKRSARPLESQPARDPVRSKPLYKPIKACREDATIGIYGCRDAEPAEPGDDAPELTPGDVLRAVKEIGLPSLQVNVQPGGETLVNVDTIFYTQPQPFERSVQLLGFDVDLVAEPVSYQWVHGDGTTATTTVPGRPYPAMDVTHRYETPAEDVQARVDVTYRVRFRVDGGPWTTIAQTLLASGPVAVLDVKEAAPVLTKP